MKFKKIMTSVVAISFLALSSMMLFGFTTSNSVFAYAGTHESEYMCVHSPHSGVSTYSIPFSNYHAVNSVLSNNIANANPERVPLRPNITKLWF